MLINNINIHSFVPIKSCAKTKSNPIINSNLAPLNRDVVSFKGAPEIKFENINFKEKFNENDMDIVNKIAKFANKEGVNIYLVGGIVRDILLGKNANDIDFLIEGDAVEFTRKFHEEHPESQIEYLKNDFGTTKLRINGEDIDIASTREESYIRKGIPQVSNIGCSMEKDVKRRDFTINSMALKLELDENCETKFIPVDIAGGLKDLNSKIISATYANSFNDDPTRILRGLKFRLRYDFKYDDKTQKMQDDFLKNPPIDEISFSRVDTTLRKLFSNKKMAPIAFEKIIEEKLYKLFTPETLAQKDWGKNIQEASEIFEIEDATNIYIRALDNKTIADILNNHPKKKLNNYEIYKSMYRKPIEDLALYYSITQDENTIKFYNELRYKKPIITGKMLIKEGFKPGKELGMLLEKLLEAKLNTDDIRTIEDEIKFIRNSIK